MSKKQKIILALVIFFCTFFQVLPIIRSGLKIQNGIGFWGPNGHDGVWHLSLINHIGNPFKIDMPSFSGELLKNYHPFFDILTALLSKIIPLGSSFWLFQLMPVLMALAILYLSFLLGQKITRNFSGGIILVLLNTFANSFGWIITLIRDRQIGGESLFWAMQSDSTQLNPPYALSLVFILFLLLIILNNCQSKFNFKNSLFIFLILLFTPITKAYGGFVVYMVFGLFSLFSVFKHRFQALIILLISLPFSFLIFNIFNQNAGSLFIYKPFWFINSMIESPDRLYIPFLANMRYALEATGKIGPRLVLVQTISFFLFILGNFSWRLLGFIKINFKDVFQKISIISIVILTLIPTFFIQKGTSWNTIQFLYYALFLANILLAVFFAKIIKSIFGKVFLILIMITFFVASLGNNISYFYNPPPAFLSFTELDCLNFLHNLPKGTVLTFPYDPYTKKQFSSTPIPLYAYETTSYVAAYSRQKTFLEDEMNLENSNYQWGKRLQESTKFFSQKSPFEDRGFLVNNQISYIYLAGIQKKEADLSNPNLYIQKIFENSECLIYKVDK